MERWFERMAAIPGLSFAGSPGVVRAAVAGASDRPDESYGSPMWPTAEGSTSATPASRHVPAEARGEALTTRVWEALEIPGSAMDYHFVLQDAVGRLWDSRRTDPGGLELLEVFALLDLELMEAAPEAVSFDSVDDATTPRSFVRVTSVPRLISLLEREGAFTEAFALAGRLARFGQGEDVTARLSEKRGALAAETSGEGGLT
ncbi:hypothetical protein [Kitasatospora herbaricolor]|uniref:hypothetical protein n=1 Tax=Kitasatospora herbaricolor TaxID=68217 RepID=UPI0036DDE541